MRGRFRGGRIPYRWRTGAGGDGGYDRERDVSLNQRTGESGEEMEGEWDGGSGGGLVPEECAPHSRRIRGSTRTAEVGAKMWVTQRRGKWASQAFRGHVRSTIEYPLWVSRVLLGREDRLVGSQGKGRDGWGQVE